MKILALTGALLCALIVSACSTAQQAQFDASLGTYAEKIQAYCPQVIAGQAIAATLVSAKAQDAFAKAQAVTTTICSSKITNSADALAAVVAAYIALQNAGVKVQAVRA